MKVLILGGYGTFGGRLARLLADDARLRLAIAGRSKARAQVFAAQLASKAGVEALVFDRDGDVSRQLAAAAPDLVIDASGPFQVYGDDPYRVAKAALAHGVDYVDLADGADFVNGIGQLDAEAKACNRFVLSGASTCPVLTAAAVRSLSHDMTRLDAITGGIGPSPLAPLGESVIRAIASYAGKPASLKRDGDAAKAYALIDSQRFTIAPPGALPLPPICFSLVDVPELRVLPQIWPELRSIWFGAGTRPALLHRALNALAWLVRLRLLPSARPFAGWIGRVRGLARWGEDRGGMFVAVEGRDADGGPIARTWHLVADGDNGPFIPAMAAAAIIRRCLDNRRPPAGARAATADLELSDYEQFFAAYGIVTGRRDELTASAKEPLFRKLLGDAWDRLPPALRAMHAQRSHHVMRGTASIVRGQGFSARLVAAIVGFPASGYDVPASVAFDVNAAREIWTRRFADKSFESELTQGVGRFERLLCERFGPCRFGIALVVEGDRLRYVVRRWSLFGVPMPDALSPRGESYEWDDDGRFRLHVEIAAPLIGPIVTYDGWLAPCE